MKDIVSRYGNWALVAGAAEGIGASFSRLFAGYGMNLILIDNSIEALDLLAVELETKMNVQTIRLYQDLSEDNAWQACLEKVEMPDFRLIVYVPAYSHVGRFSKYTPDELNSFLALNTRTPVHFVHSFIRRQEKEKNSGIILMSSLAGIIGPALVAPYAATKAFSVLLSESLFYELKKDNIDIIACCAGPTSTPTYWKSNPGNQSKLIEVMQPDDVASYAIKMLGKRSSCIPGWKNRLFYYFLTRILPRNLAGRFVSKSMLKMYSNL
jgi:short-subunit dehydrogenase